jgi:hypothetical protein
VLVLGGVLVVAPSTLFLILSVLVRVGRTHQSIYFYISNYKHVL